MRKKMVEPAAGILAALPTREELERRKSELEIELRRVCQLIECRRIMEGDAPELPEPPSIGRKDVSDV